MSAPVSRSDLLMALTGEDGPGFVLAALETLARDVAEGNMGSLERDDG